MKIFSFVFIIIAIATIIIAASTTISAKKTLTLESRYVHLVPNPKPINGWVKQVEELPSYPGKAPPIPIYSGMVEITRLRNSQPGVEQVFMHYTLVGNKFAQRNNIIAIESGGPGFPSSGFLFMEGASGLQLNSYSYLTEEYQRTGIPSPQDRDFPWTELGVLIGLDNPPPTGYSYCMPAGPATSNGSSCGTWTDGLTGIAQAEALNVILTDHFPNLLPQGTDRKIYSVAESYGGVYAAALAEQIFTRPEYARLAARFAGQANGDACMGSDFICGNAMESKPFWFLSFMYGHAQLSEELWQALIAACGETALKTIDPDDYNAECTQAYNAANNAIGNSFYAYNLYSNCAGNLFGSSELSSSNPILLGKKHDTINNKHNSLIKTHHRKGPLRRHFKKNSERLASTSSIVDTTDITSTTSSPSAINWAENYNGYICMSDAFPKYMDRPEVKTAFGVPADSHFFIADDAEGLPYNFTLMNGFKIWRDVINADLNISGASNNVLPRPVGSPKVRVIGYQGDADPSVLVTWTQRVWYEFANNFTKLSTKNFVKTREWGDYFLASPETEPSNPFSQVQAGKVVEWGIPGTENSKLVSYVTVSGSGHMVPEFAGRSALAMARKFIYDDQ